VREAEPVGLHSLDDPLVARAAAERPAAQLTVAPSGLDRIFPLWQFLLSVGSQSGIRRRATPLFGVGTTT
jgi:hypothetical protein